jgi:hypothetical protein
VRVAVGKVTERDLTLVRAATVAGNCTKEIYYKGEFQEVGE